MFINYLNRFKNNIDTETNILSRRNFHEQKNIIRKFEFTKL